jgi:hypothetical protein
LKGRLLIQVNIHFAVEGSGVMTLAKAEALVELPDLPEKVKKVKKDKAGSKNATVSNSTESSDDKEAGGDDEEKDSTTEVCALSNPMSCRQPNAHIPIQCQTGFRPLVDRL